MEHNGKKNPFDIWLWSFILHIWGLSIWAQFDQMCYEPCRLRNVYQDKQGLTFKRTPGVSFFNYCLPTKEFCWRLRQSSMKGHNQIGFLCGKHWLFAQFFCALLHQKVFATTIIIYKLKSTHQRIHREADLWLLECQ